jgi:tripartite-type tricarboxylate transporter receptor subunit TctC
MLPALSGARRIAKTEFIAWAAANTDKANYCSIGSGSTSHLAAELFKRMAGVAMTHLPFTGSGAGRV